jgi:phosphatidate cytidylyltransferase
MAVLTAGVLVLDQYVAAWLHRPIYPCLLLGVALLVALSTVELHALLSAHSRPPLWLCLSGCLSVALAGLPAQLGWRGEAIQPWRDTAWVMAAVVLAGFLREMAIFHEPGGVVVRLALLTWITGYLGLLPSFFVQVRFWPEEAPPLAGVTALVLVIFVPKGCDIGAYFTGRALGRTRMTPRLSPKKTWEGLLGGLALSVLVAVGVHRLVTPMFRCDLEAAAFGLVVAMAGVLGDLAESLIKRDCQKKDASQSVPGFGGILDVVDSVLFAAPVSYWWLLR